MRRGSFGFGIGPFPPRREAMPGSPRTAIGEILTLRKFRRHALLSQRPMRSIMMPARPVEDEIDAALGTRPDAGGGGVESSRDTRRVAAIAFGDVVGYSTLM